MRATPRLLALLALAPITLAIPAHAEGLKLDRVMLSSGGVAYVEYAGMVDGAATLGLDVPLDQVDDVLTSLVVFDRAGGIDGLELPGRDGARAAFGDVPFTRDALRSPLAFLNSLQGVRLTVTGPRPLTGRLIHAERVAAAAAANQPPAAPRTRVTLMTKGGLAQFILEDADRVEVTDPGLRARIHRAIAALQGEAGHNARHITLRLSAGPAGAGARTVRVGYVAAAAIWKASYRLVLPPRDSGGKARLQGWAVLENTTGADWNGIHLALQYGNPVSFHQAIYRSYFARRPEVPVEIMGHILPPVDTGATPMAKAAPPPPPAPAAAPAPRARDAAREMSVGGGAAIAPPARRATGAEGAVDTVFTIARPVFLGAGHTASLPIIDREVAARRVGLVQQGRRHPLAAVALTNDSPTSLPAGVLTLYDAGAHARFAGDARLGGLPAGETRLLAFAEDLRTKTRWTTDTATTVASLTAARGVVRLAQRRRWTANIDLTAPAHEARHLLIEIPRHGDGRLVLPDGLAPSGQTAAAWRVPLTLAPGEHRRLTVHVDRLAHRQLALTSDDRLIARLLGMEGLDDDARARLAHLAALRATEATHAAERDRLRGLRQQAEHDEARIRQNLAAVPEHSALKTRLLKQLATEEDRIDQLAQQIARAEAATRAAHAALASAISELKI